MAPVLRHILLLWRAALPRGAPELVGRAAVGAGPARGGGAGGEVLAHARRPPRAGGVHTEVWRAELGSGGGGHPRPGEWRRRSGRRKCGVREREREFTPFQPH